MAQSGSLTVRSLRGMNAVLMAVFTVGALTQYLKSVTEKYDGTIAFILGYTIGFFLVYFIVCLPLFLAWRGLSPKIPTDARVVRVAKNVNLLVSILLGLTIIGMFGALSQKTITPTESLGFLLLLSILLFPYAFNAVALSKRKSEVKAVFETATETEEMPETKTALLNTDSAPIGRPSKSPNYFIRHWNGELSLGMSYWVNNNGAGIVALLLIAYAGTMEASGYSLRSIAIAGALGLIFFVLVWIWSSVGIWRSANNNVRRGGSAFWSMASQVMVVLGGVAMAGQLNSSILPQVKEFALIASGNDPFGRIDVKVSSDGQAVILTGLFGEGSADEVRRILNAAPAANSLVLNSHGGRILEAKQLAELVRGRNLHTYVENQCASACTYVFLAGVSRAATPNAKIGFHQPSFPGLDKETQESATRDMLDVYRKAGLPEPFIQRIAKTPSDDMWYPARDELVTAHVITRVSLGGEAATIGTRITSKDEFLRMLRTISLYQAIEKRFPEIAQTAAKKGWEAKEQSGKDAEIKTAMRQIIADVFPELLKTADDSTLDRFVKLFLLEAQAARSLSQEACFMLISAKLDISQTLPKEVSEQEKEFLIEALGRPAAPPVAQPDPLRLQEVLQKVFENLSEQEIAALDDPEAHADQPGLVCDSMITFYQTVNSLPARDRHVVLRGMLQGDSASNATPVENSSTEDGGVR